MLLPFCSPRCGDAPLTRVEGHPLMHQDSFLRLIRRHHILGSATLLQSDKGESALACTKSDKPFHTADRNTFFRVASITKIATAVLALRFVDEGLLDLDRPVRNYFSDPSASCLREITLRQLLSHTSGLTDPPDLEKKAVSGKPFPLFLESATNGLAGNSFQYSNLGYGIIGCVFESVLSRPVGSIFQQYLFSPLGMNSTLEGCLLPRERIMPVTRVFPWNGTEGLVLTALGSKPLVSADPLCHYGYTAGSMYTDIVSLSVLLNMLIRNHTGFLSETSLSEMKRLHSSYGRPSPSLSYGLGLLIINDSTLSDGRILGHQGFAYGCADGAFWEESTGRLLLHLNGGCSEARTGRLGLANRDLIRWAFRKELPSW